MRTWSATRRRETGDGTRPSAGSAWEEGGRPVAGALRLRRAAIRAGLGYGLLPLEQCAVLLEAGALVNLTPHLHVDVALYWHAWRIQPPRLERMGAALVKAAHGVLLPIA